MCWRPQIKMQVALCRQFGGVAPFRVSEHACACVQHPAGSSKEAVCLYGAQSGLADQMLLCMAAGVVQECLHIAAPVESRARAHTPRQAAPRIA